MKRKLRKWAGWMLVNRETGDLATFEFYESKRDARNCCWDGDSIARVTITEVRKKKGRKT